MTQSSDAATLDAAAQPARRALFSPFAAEAVQIVRLAGPLTITQLAQMAVLTTDVIMLGRFDKSALASAAIGNVIFYFAWLIGMGPVSALSPMIAHALGARPRARVEVRRIVRMGLWSILLSAPPLMLLLQAAAPILVFLRQDPALAAGAGRFVGLLALGLPLSIAYQALRNVSTALGRPTAALWVMAATIGFNFLGDYTLIFGHFGAPRLGLVGAGLATSASFAFSALAMAVVMRLDPVLRRYRILRRFLRPDWRRLGEAVRLGSAIGVTMIFEAMLFNSMTLVMGAFGTAALAAHQIALNVASITFMGPLGVGMAATVRVGLAAGAGDGRGVRRAGFAAMAVSSGLAGVCGVAMALFAPELAGLYVTTRTPADLKVIALASRYLKVAAAFQLFDALQVVGAMSLRGLKDARGPMVLAGASYWIAGAPTCIILAFVFHLGGLGVWIGLAFGLAVAALSMGLRFWRLAR